MADYAVAAHAGAARDRARARSGTVVAAVGLLMFALLLKTFIDNAQTGNAVFGWDFYGSVWAAAHAILHGASPYPASHGHLPSNAFVYPPLLGELAVPLTVFPAAVALAVWDALSFAALAASLWLVGVRDWRCYLIALASLPMAAMLILGQPTAFLVLAAAVAWRYRDQPAIAGLAGGVALAAKPMGWPLLIWLLASKRTRAALFMVVAAVVTTLLSWAAIGFNGMADFPRLMAQLSSTWGTRENSMMSLAVRLGASTTIGWLLVIVVLSSLLVTCVVLCRRRHEIGGFAVAMAACAYSGPLVHHHYLLFLIVGFAAAWPKPRSAWLLIALFWISPTEPQLVAWKMVVFALAALAVTVAAVRGAADRRRSAMPVPMLTGNV